jgi:predicted hydrocarbon binding protein
MPPRPAPPVPTDPPAGWHDQLRQADGAGAARNDQIRVQPGHQPYRHNYYTDGTFFRHDAISGAVTNVYGQRVLRVSEDFITGLLAGLEEEVGDAAGEIMYKVGYQWGMKDMKSYSERAAREFEVAFDKMSVGMMLETWWWPLTVEGWGTWRYDFREKKQGLIFIDLFESAVAQSLGDVGKVVCYFYAGLFAAAFTTLAKRELACIEIQCYSMGEDHCKFLVSTAKRVNAASFWRNEGATTKDIVKKLQQGV